MGCGGSNDRSSSPDKKTAFVNKANFEEKYELKETLGTGSIAEVWLATSIETKEDRAVKIIKKDQKSDTNLSKMIKDETDSLATLDDGNIVKICEVFEDEQKFYIVMEYLQGPNMSEYLAANPKSSLSEAKIADWMKQILGAISHCHSKEIVHSDIRPSNIVFADIEGKIPKLIDFNFSKTYNPDDGKVEDIYAAPAYVAPEMLTKKEYSKKTDIWSSGILLYFIIAGRNPYSAKTLKDLLAEIKAWEFTEEKVSGEDWEDISPECKKFIEKMLTSDPEKRATAEELLTDPWLSTTNESPLKSEKDMKAEFNKQKFEHAIMAYMINQWDMDVHTKNLDKLFKKMDKNGDRLLNRTELRNALKASGIVMSNIQFDKMFRSIDKDGSGNINYKEYMTEMTKDDVAENDAPLAKAFDAFVGNNEKIVKKADLLSIMEDGWMGDLSMAKLFNEVHTDEADEVL